MRPKLGAIVVGVAHLDLNEDITFDAALQIAESSRAVLHVVHAWEVPLPPGGAFGEFIPVVEPESLAPDMRMDLERRVRGWTSYPQVECHSIRGAATQVLARVVEEQEADLCVVGAGRGAHFGQRVFGTTAQRLMRGAAGPLLVVRETFRRPVRNVLLTTDLSGASAEIHELATSLVHDAFAADAPALRSLHVVQPTTEDPHPDLGDVLLKLEQFLRPLNQRGSAVVGTVRRGEPAAAIVNLAASLECELLVVGTHSRRGLDRLMLGSVAERVTRDARCNVLVIPLKRVSAQVAPEEMPPVALARSS
jgi:nucleotide-binding universal stress UspA family protein